jgi:hypothetical protein
MSNKTLQDVLKWLELEIKSLENEINTRNQKIEKLDKLIIGLKKFSSSEEYKELYEKEKDRLVKLHSYYTQIEADRQDLKTKVEGWEKWFSLNRQSFDKLFSSAPPEGLFSPEKKNENTKSINIKRKKLKK